MKQILMPRKRFVFNMDILMDIVNWEGWEILISYQNSPYNWRGLVKAVSLWMYTVMITNTFSLNWKVITGLLFVMSLVTCNVGTFTILLHVIIKTEYWLFVLSYYTLFTWSLIRQENFILFKLTWMKMNDSTKTCQPSFLAPLSSVCLLWLCVYVFQGMYWLSLKFLLLVNY